MTSKRNVEVLWDPPDSPADDCGKNNFEKNTRVAAYCRVSTALDDQTDSFELQEQYYTRLILSRPGWKLAGIYADKGISGTQRKQRTGFERMLRHCEEGKIDRIICKSISRFARNTADLLEVIRNLKQLNIGVVFEKEGIDTLCVEGEFLLSTIAAIAQDESRSISENMTWAFQKRFQQGIPVFQKLLGYNIEKKRGEKIITINEQEAAIVREIYSLKLEGMNYTDIARLMIKKGYKNIRGNNEWSFDLIKGILTNERYTGDVLCQKTYTENYITHKTKRNDSAVKQYFIENHHPPIISREMFYKVQELISSKKTYQKSPKVSYPFSGRIYCGKCRARYHRYIPGKNAKWKCSRSMKSNLLCDCEPINENVLKNALIKAFDIRYNLSEKSSIYKLELDIKRLQEYDNIERSRIILKKELSEALRNELHTTNSHDLKQKRLAIENQMEAHEKFWAFLEKDRMFRTTALKWIEELPHGKERMKVFFEQFNMEYIRAWVIEVTILSPIIYAIKWFDNTEIKIELTSNGREAKYFE